MLKWVKSQRKNSFAALAILFAVHSMMAQAEGSDLADCLDSRLHSSLSASLSDQTDVGYLNKDHLKPGETTLYNPLAAQKNIYVMQIRAANARPKASGIERGTIEDMLQPTSDYEKGITLSYLHDLGVNMIWLLPIFPTNSEWNLPSPTDTWGSPYAVRDYMHVSGLISKIAQKTGRNEFSYEESGQPPAWGDESFKKLVTEAKKKNIDFMLDIAANHFGHNYLYYDYAKQTPIRERVKAGQNLDDLWDYEKTFEPELLHPDILDTPEKIAKLTHSDPKVMADLEEFKKRAPDLKGDELVRDFNMWRAMTDSERARYNPSKPNYLEYQATGFYVDSDGKPSKGVGDNYTKWPDVKFLDHQEKHGSDPERGDYYATFVRNREYIFRILNYYVSLGVRGFRLDHAADFQSGLSANEWRYIFGKVTYYDWVRQGKPKDYKPVVFHGEDFDDSMRSSEVFDILTEGYVRDIRGEDGPIKDTAYIEAQLDKANRFSGKTLILHGLGTQDESRLINPHTGFDIYSGAAFYAIGAFTPGAPLITSGDEFGEPWQMNFRAPDYLRARFKNEPNYHLEGNALIAFYSKINKARLDPLNSAVTSPNYSYLRLKDGGGSDPSVFAAVRWDAVHGRNAFVFVKPWIATPSDHHYFISPEIADKLGVHDDGRYHWVDGFTNKALDGCFSGASVKWDLPVHMNGVDRVQLLRLEPCH